MSRQRLLSFCCTGLLIAAAIALLLLVVETRTVAQRVTSKAAAPHATTMPADFGAALSAEFQVEPHTCGLHALRTVYRGYGLDPDEENLRFRLGVDRDALLTLPNTSGTLHPDLLRVLVADGFSFVILELDQPSNAVRALQRHLSEGQHALALIMRPVSGGLHWVAVENSPSGQVRLHDSLERTPVDYSVRGFLRNQALSVILVRPADAAAPGSAAQTQQSGLAEMARTYTRWQVARERTASTP